MEINGAQMFVKALQEEHVDTLFAYPGGTAIDLFDALYDAEGIDMILPRHEQHLFMRRMDMQDQQGRLVYAWLPAVPVQPIWLQELQQQTMTVFHLYVLPDRYR